MPTRESAFPSRKVRPELIQLFFIEHRTRVLDTAAVLDRLGRAEGDEVQHDRVRRQ